jgi:hypothetical protein
VSARPIDLIASAATTTLASGSARVQRIRFADPPPPPERDWGQTELGVTDFERRRTKVEQTTGPGLELSVKRLVEQHPWLDDEDGEEEQPNRIVYAGTASFFFGGGVQISEDDIAALRRRHSDPVWIVEALQFADRAEALDRREPVRGDRCVVFRFGLDLEHHRSQLEIPGHFGSTAPRLRGEAWVDDPGRIRRVTWTRLDYYRPRARYRQPSQTQHWQRTELWDFGVEAKIEVPHVEPSRSPPFPIGLAQMVWYFWRRKRAYERRL